MNQKGNIPGSHVEEAAGRSVAESGRPSSSSHADPGLLHWTYCFTAQDPLREFLVISYDACLER